MGAGAASERVVVMTLARLGRRAISVGHPGVCSQAPLLDSSTQERVPRRAPTWVDRYRCRVVARRLATAGRAGRIILGYSTSVDSAYPHLPHHRAPEAGLGLLARGLRV